MTSTITMHVTTSSRLARTAGLTTLAALATNLAVFGLARARDVNFEFPKPGSASGTQTVTAATVAAVTVLALVVGWAVAALAATRRRPTMHTMAIIGGAFAVVSTLAPLTVDSGLSVKLTLASLHLIAGAFYTAGIVGLRRASARATL